MAEQLLAARVKAPSATAGAASRRLFLCHNSSDKAILREVAEAVELEFGIPNFLDAFSIPAGVEFIPFIERELGSCHGCAIFLGANGWGRTHLWEAERAVARYRQDPNFKLIPVALPGVTDAAMKQLASGSVFGAINWVDFRKSPRDRENVRKLYAALTGTTAEPDWVRGGLTPYILRRDARRWREQGGGDKSLLYTGAKLREGQRLLETASDLLDVGEVAAFLRKSDLRQRRFWQTLASVTAVASVLLLATAITAWVQANLASQRQRIAVSRMLALEADRARGVDRQLLIAAQAVATTPTPEARAKLIDRLARWMSLVALTHFPGQEITAVAYAADRNALLLGMSDGTVHQLELELRAAGREEQGAVLPGGRRPVFEARGEGIVRAIHAQNGMPVIVGFQSGRVDAIDASGAIRRLRAAPPPEISSGGMRDRAVISLAASPEAARLAIGDARGMVEILLMSEPATPPVIVDLTDRLRATALAFIGEGMLAVGTATGTIELVDAGLGKILDTLPKQDTIVALAHRGSDGQLVAVNDRNVVRTWKLAATPPLLRSGPDTSRFEAPPFLSAAHIDPRAGQVALGSADGWLELREVPGQAVLDRLQAHRQVVSAFAFIDAGRTLTSVGRDGMVAI